MVAISPGPLCLRSDDSPAVPVRVATRGLLRRGNGVAYKTRFQKVQQEQRIYLDSHVWTPRAQSKIRIVDEAKVKQIGKRAVSVASWKTRYVPHSVEYEPGETRICPSGQVPDAPRRSGAESRNKVSLLPIVTYCNCCWSYCYQRRQGCSWISDQCVSHHTERWKRWKGRSEASQITEGVHEDVSLTWGEGRSELERFNQSQSSTFTHERAAPACISL